MFVVLLHVAFWIILNSANQAPALQTNIQYITLQSMRVSSQQAMHASLITPPASAVQPLLPPRNRIQQPSVPTSKRTSITKQTTDTITAIEPTLHAEEQPATHLPNTGNAQKLILDGRAIQKTLKGIAAEQRNKERVLPGTTKQLTEKEKFEQAVSQSGRQDCKTQYADFGILAIPLLLKDAVTRDGCKW